MSTDFRSIIKQMMVEKGNISIAKLARHPNVQLHSGTLYNYLRHDSDMTGENIAKVLDALKKM